MRSAQALYLTGRASDHKIVFPVIDKMVTSDQPRKIEGLEIHAVADRFVVYESGTDRIHYLNATAALVLEFCDGSHSLAEIAALVQEAYGLPSVPVSEVSDCLTSLQEAGIVR